MSLFDVLPRTAATTSDGRLAIGGCALADLAAEFGTPAFVVDERALRETARSYLDAFARRHPRTHVHFASKALPCAPVTRMLAEEGLGCDVASAGELAIALAAGFPPAEILLHGNAKSDEDIAAALAAGVGMIVIDGPDDVDRIERLASARQRVLVRINPSVPGQTHAAMDTGSPEAKFGVSLDAAPALLERIAASGAARRCAGCTSTSAPSCSTSTASPAPPRRSPRLAASRSTTSAAGWGSRIARRSDAPAVEDYAAATVAALRNHLDTDAQLIVEPGRSVVGRSIVTLYSVVTVKRGHVTHVAVNGGMGDNLEPMLYGQQFAPAIVDRERPPETCDLVGHHCESGDILGKAVELATPEVGDLVVMPVTGAYCYSLANNYNGARRPPVVICRDGDARLAVRRETTEDLLARDVG